MRVEGLNLGQPVQEIVLLHGGQDAGAVVGEANLAYEWRVRKVRVAGTVAALPDLGQPTLVHDSLAEAARPHESPCVSTGKPRRGKHRAGVRRIGP